MFYPRARRGLAAGAVKEYGGSPLRPPVGRRAYRYVAFILPIDAGAILVVSVISGQWIFQIA